MYYRNRLGDCAFSIKLDYEYFTMKVLVFESMIIAYI
jgi:hypothetical protein